MKTKLMLLVFVLLASISNVNAQFNWDNEQLPLPNEITLDTVVAQPVDTTSNSSPAIIQDTIRILNRTWNNLEQNLKDEVIRLSKETSPRTIKKEELTKWVYKITDVPTKSGKKTVYLSILMDKSYFLSSEDPSDAQEICACFLDVSSPQINIQAGKHQTDDSDYFGQGKSNGANRNIKNLW